MQPPRATVTSLTREKLTYRAESDEAVVQFAFDQPVTAWTVRINSSSHLDGTAAVVLTQITGLGFGRMPFGHGPFGHATQGSMLNGEARVDATMLLHGANRVDIYGRGLDGRWTLPPVDREPAPA